MVLSDLFSQTELTDDVFKELLPFYLHEITDDFSMLQKAFKNGDFDQVGALAHKIKGASASYSAKVVFAKGKALEEAIRFGNYKVKDEVIELDFAIKRTNAYAQNFIFK